MNLDGEQRRRCRNRPPMTRDQAEAKVELYAQHRFDLDAYECIECGRWHLQSHWTK